MLYQHVIDQFMVDRREGDFDYVTAITQTLADLGHPNPKAWEEYEKIKQVRNSNPLVQASACMQFWRMFLMTSQKNTEAERFCLGDPAIDPADFMKLFRLRVAPTLVRMAIGHTD
jgi:hypothetical protein